MNFRSESDFVPGDGGKASILTRLESSKIPFLKASDLFMPKGSRPVWTGGPQPAVPCALAHKIGDPETHILFDNGHWFHDQQTEVTYVPAALEWPGPELPRNLTPQSCPKLSPG